MCAMNGTTDARLHEMLNGSTARGGKDIWKCFIWIRPFRNVWPATGLLIGHCNFFPFPLRFQFFPFLFAIYTPTFSSLSTSMFVYMVARFFPSIRLGRRSDVVDIVIGFVIGLASSAALDACRKRWISPICGMVWQNSFVFFFARDRWVGNMRGWYVMGWDGIGIVWLAGRHFIWRFFALLLSSILQEKKEEREWSVYRIGKLKTGE